MDDSFPTLHSYLPDIQEAICGEYQNAECSVEMSPELTEPPYNFEFHSLGKKISSLPPGSDIPKDFYQITTTSEGIIVTDGLSGQYLHLLLEGGNDWKTPLQKVFNEKLGTNWCFLVLELQSNTAQFHIFNAETKPNKMYAENTRLWLSELKQMQAVQVLPKPKSVKKIVKKSVTDKTVTDSETNGKTTTTKITKNGHGQKIVRKKLAAAITTPSTTDTTADDDMKNRTHILVNTTTKINSDAQNSNTLTNIPVAENYVNGNGSADSGVSFIDSDTEKCINGDKLDECKHIQPLIEENGSMNATELDASHPISTSETDLKSTNNDHFDTSNNKTTVVNSETDNNIIQQPSCIINNHSNQPRLFTMHRNSIKHEINERVGKILEEEEEEDEGKDKSSEDWNKSVQLINGHSMTNCSLNEYDRIFPKRSLASANFNSTFSRSFMSSDTDSLQRFPSKDDSSIMRKYTDEEMPPVQVLQLVLKKFSYKELGELRQVHPHWDEICGQTMNGGYHELIKKANKLLTECQQRVHSEPSLHDVLSILTSVQVHILNPVDILRPAMDEGVCCFPYGKLLDQTFCIVEKAKEMMKGKRDITIDWKPVAELARRAKVHYKTYLASLMEEKLGEVVRLKALQSIQRIDSFMIDSTVNKLEKATHMARDELEWEIEQLRQQNTQLKKDNRELKKDCMKLEARVEILENKFKTMARLLQ